MVDEDGDELEVSSEELVEGDLSATYEIEGDTLYITNWKRMSGAGTGPWASPGRSA